MLDFISSFLDFSILITLIISIKYSKKTAIGTFGIASIINDLISFFVAFSKQCFLRFGPKKMYNLFCQYSVLMTS